MRFAIYDLRFASVASMAALLTLVAAAFGQETNGAAPIDLATALRLAGAQNLDVQMARERVNEARSIYRSAVAQFFPSIAPGVGFRAHEDNIQDVAGNILDVHKHSYAPGATLGVQLDIGDALYKTLAAKQRSRAAGFALTAQRQETVLAAGVGYFDLAQAQASIKVAEDAVRISSDYAGQVERAVDAGLALRGDLLRVRVQTERNQLNLRERQEHQRLASARLAQILRLDPAVDLLASEAELVPLALVETNAGLSSLVESAQAMRPELKESQALVAAARETKKGVTVGPLIPTVGAQAFFGGLGGGRSGVGDTFGAQEDYAVGLSWRIGPGGLFDADRKRIAESRLQQAEIGSTKTRIDLTRQIVEAFTRWQSAGDQMQTAQRALAAAEEGFRLAQERKEFAVGVVLETVLAEQDLTRARFEFLRAIAGFNQAQYALSRAAGKL